MVRDSEQRTIGTLQAHESAINLGQRLTHLTIGVGSVAMVTWGAEAFLPPRNLDLVGLSLVIGALVLVVYPAAGVYRSWRTAPLRAESAALLRGWFSVLVILLLFRRPSSPTFNYSVEFLALWAVMGGGLQVGGHVGLRLLLRRLRRSGRNTRQVLIVGTSAIASRVADHIEHHPEYGFRLLGLLATDPDETPPAPSHGTILGSLEDCETLCANKVIDHVYVCIPLEKVADLDRLLGRLQPLAAEIHWVPDIAGLQLINQRISQLGDLTMLTLTGAPLKPVDQAVKFLVDKVLTLIALILLVPFMTLIAVAVKLTSPGPIFFVQKRHGLKHQTFNCLKFRSMILHEEPGGQVSQAQRNDPRVTRLGALLRATSCDELPQLFNVLKGDMSLVGPRPHACVHNRHYEKRINGYAVRHLVKPGLTGWAQVCGWRGETDSLDKMEGRIDHDLYYIQNWSVWFDFKILFLTVIHGFANTKAH